MRAFQAAPVAGQCIGGGLALARGQQRTEFGTDALLLHTQCVAQRIPIGIAEADGNPLAQPLRQALVTRDRKQVFRLDDGIPVLLAEEAIATAQIADFPSA